MAKDPGILAASTLTRGVGTVAGGFLGRDAENQMGEFQAKQLRGNAQIAELQGQDLLRQGNFEAGKESTQTAKIIGEQKVAAAGSGNRVGVGTDSILEDQTRGIGSRDAMQLINNAHRGKFGYDVQAENDREDATMALLNARAKGRSTLFASLYDKDSGLIPMATAAQRAISDAKAESTANQQSGYK